nr:protein kinase [Kofleriaceae bacterium]
MGNDEASRHTETTLPGGPIALADTMAPMAPASEPADPAEPPIQLASGARLRQYELIRELGRGGMGTVWAARDLKLGRRVAIKFLLAQTREIAERFLHEARATARCQHDHIVIIHEVDEHRGMPYMVLEYLEGQPLRAVMGGLGSGVRLPASRVVELALPIARALSLAHELGIVHRDLKPENVVVTTAGQVKVLDFGIAKALTASELAAATPVPARPRAPTVDELGGHHATRDGSLVGTIPYMSPEQLGADTVDHRSDLWALGVMLFEMLAGRHPIENPTMEAVFATVRGDEPMPSIRSCAPDVPDALAALVDGCLVKAKADRIGRASDVARALGDLQPGRRGRALDAGESPYPGLVAFQETDADRFFGREREVARMVARVRELPITGVVGPSGAGKSSFVRAGLAPALRAADPSFEMVTLRPGRHPLAALATIVQRLTTRDNDTSKLDEHRTLVERMRREPGLMGAALRARARDAGGQVLLYVDQFEELYTLATDRAERLAFTAALAGVADDTAAPLRVVVSMRSDFLDRVAEDPRFLDELTRGLVVLAPPERASLREALIAPIDLVGHRFESSAMIEDMLDALATTPGALPLLQFAASKLWEARDRERKLITVASYNAIGGIAGALATHADDVVARQDAVTRRATQRLMRRLVTPERTRAIVELGELDTDRDAARVVDQLVAARLLVVQRRGDAGGGTVELVHESLIESWPTLRRWLDEDHDDAAVIAQITSGAKQWDAKGRPAGLLWRGDALDEARRWLALRPRDLPPRDRAFLDAGFAIERRGKRVRRTAAVVAFAVVGAFAIVASVGYVQIRAAEQRTAAALDDERREAAERAAAQAQTDAANAERARAEAARATAEQKRATAQAAATDANNDAKSAHEDLAQRNEQLRSALAQAQTARQEADDKNAKLQAAQKAIQDGAAAVRAENARLKAQNAELQTISQKLKGM